MGWQRWLKIEVMGAPLAIYTSHQALRFRIGVPAATYYSGKGDNG